MLEVSRVTAAYDGAPVIRDVSLGVRAGEIVALLGANGAGKTTLNRVVSGLIAPVSGTVVFDGADITGLPAVDIVARGLIHVPEGRKIFPNLSVRDNLELGSYARARRRRRLNFERVLDVFPPLRARLAQHAGTLSGGEQQMLAIGRGLMGEPKLLILDEPSLGLSPRLVEDMFGLIARVAASGLAILIVEQNVVQSLELSARAYVMEHGEIVMSGTAAELLASPALEKAYLGL